MDDSTQLTPPAPEPDPTGGSVPSTPSPAVASATPSWWSRWYRLVIAAAGVAIVLGVAATALLLVLKPAPSIARMVPATADVYLNVNLDPSVTQKMNLLQAVHRFPDTSTDQKISDLLDKWGQTSGVRYSRDIEPWLGSGIGLATKVPSGSSDLWSASMAPAATLAVSRDDARAEAFLGNIRAGKYTIASTQKAVFNGAGASVYSPQNYTWQDKSYDGITLTVGTPRTNGPQQIAYAIVDHVVVVTNNEAFLREIIDTAHGRAPRLVDSAQYKATIAKLPSDYIAVGYVNGSIAARVKDQLRTPMASSLGGLGNLNQLDAFQGAAMVISARSDGIVADATIRVDSSKLSPATRQLLNHAGRPDKVIGWVPASTDAFFAFGNLKQTIQSLIDQVGSQPSVQQSTDEIGLTGPHGVLSHLTGDFAIEVGINRAFVPAGAVMVGTDSAPAMRVFFVRIMSLATEGSTDQPAPTTSTYRGVMITTITDPSWGPVNLFAPSYAVVDGMGVVASNPSELKAIIDAHRDHSGVDHDATYVAASQASLSNAGSVFYVAIGRLVNTLQSAPAGSPIGALHDTVSRNGDLAPLRAFIETSSSSQDGILERLIVFIQ